MGSHFSEIRSFMHARMTISKCFEISKIYLDFQFSKIQKNFEAFRQLISSSINLFYLKKSVVDFYPDKQKTLHFHGKIIEYILFYLFQSDQTKTQKKCSIIIVLYYNYMVYHRCLWVKIHYSSLFDQLNCKKKIFWQCI